MKTIISIFILIFGCGIYLNGQSTSYEIVQYFPSNRQWCENSNPNLFDKASCSFVLNDTSYVKYRVYTYNEDLKLDSICTFQNPLGTNCMDLREYNYLYSSDTIIPIKISLDQKKNTISFGNKVYQTKNKHDIIFFGDNLLLFKVKKKGNVTE